MSNPTTNEVLRPRREYNQWVANEMLEDFALRYTARRSRHRSFFKIGNTAIGTSSFLVLELLGATIALSYGVYHSLWAIGVVCVLLFLTGLPVSYYASRYSVDIDLLTRGAGFGYIGSTITSLIYASFTFIFFALEAVIMASALELLIGIPLWLGYIISALIVIPLVTHGLSVISRLQTITQPLWLILQMAPIIYIVQHPSGLFEEWIQFAGLSAEAGSPVNEFSWLAFGSATLVLFALFAQIGEQVDFLRFLPEPDKSSKQRLRWWGALIVGGPGWVLFGALKLVLGALLGYLLIMQGLAPEEASDPAHMYMITFAHFTGNETAALLVAAVFVVVCQLKINVANAYAGSLAWSNFFSRLTHYHPGRMVWVIFNVLIALLLMELGVYRAVETVLHHYSALVLAWLGSIVADLVINKPLGLSPRHIEFKRSKLCDINPVGVGSMTIAATAGIASSLGVFGELAMSMTGFITLLLPFLTVPLIAKLTKSRYYYADENHSNETPITEILGDENPATEAQILTSQGHPMELQCMVCENHFDQEDMTTCPAYRGNICSLCCALETRCKDQCRPNAHFKAQIRNTFESWLPSPVYNLLTGTIGHFLLLFQTFSLVVLGIFALSYLSFSGESSEVNQTLVSVLTIVFFLLLIVQSVIMWLFVLARVSNSLALLENNLETTNLATEINVHRDSLQELDDARKQAESANRAKSHYVTSLSHELRTPLNVILGYAQLLKKGDLSAEKQQESVAILKRNGEYLAHMIEGLLEISKIETGKLSLNYDEVRLRSLLEQIVIMFRQQAAAKGLYFHVDLPANLPEMIRVDENRLRQILINLISNAIKFTSEGGIELSVSYRSHVARFCVRDTGPGISQEELVDIFRPFQRGEITDEIQIPGSGLGLAISKQLANMMGADISATSVLGEGSEFTLILQASPRSTATVENVHAEATIVGFKGKVNPILVVDDQPDHRQLIVDWLSPLGFPVLEASDTKSAFSVIDNMDGQPGFAFIDIRLGFESGWDLAEILRDRFRTLPIMMLSANARGFYVNQPERQVHNAYEEKPLQFDSLIKKMSKLIDVEWIYSDTNASRHFVATTETRDGANISTLSTLRKLAKVGNLNGFNHELAALFEQQLISENFYRQLKELADQYALDHVNEILDDRQE